MKKQFGALVVIGVAAVALAGCGSSGGSSSGYSSTSSSSSTATTAAIDAKQLFVAGNAATGATACGSCHTLGAAGTTSSVGPNLDKIAPDDTAKVLRGMIVNPDEEIVAGYTKGVMPHDYAKTLTPAQVTALARYIDHNSQHAE